MTDPTPRITITQIQQATAEHFGIPLHKLRGSQRMRKFVRPRQIAMYLACELTEKSLPQIGRIFDRDHTTIIHGRDLIADLARYDRSIAKAIDDITRQLTDDPRQIILPLVA